MSSQLSSSAQKQTDDEIILISVFGVDQPGIVSLVTQILARYEATILDIGQAVIHQNLNLGVLVALSSSVDRSALESELSRAIESKQNRIKYEPISHESYEQWVMQQGKPRHIVTLLARHVEAEHIASVTDVAFKHGLSFDQITRLSGRIPLADLSSQTKSSVEFSARGRAANLADLRADFMQLASQFDIDIAVQEDNLYRRNRRLVCFDMDSTLIEAEVIDELAKAAGVGKQVAAITEAAMSGEIDFNESFSRRMALLKGLDESTLSTIAEGLKLTEGAEKLFINLKKLGYKTAILSGGFDYFARFLQTKLGVDYVYANQLEVVDGKVTGNVIGTVVNGERKAYLLKEIAQKEDISLEQVIAVGDGANDLPMLSIAGLGIAFRAKPLVKASAKQSISQLGLDAILYLMGLSDRETGKLLNG